MSMKGLTTQEIKTLVEAEDILFSRLDGETKEIFNDSAIALYKAIRKYVKFMTKEIKSDADEAIKMYIESDIIGLTNLYNEKGSE